MPGFTESPIIYPVSTDKPGLVGKSYDPQLCYCVPCASVTMFVCVYVVVYLFLRSCACMHRKSIQREGKLLIQLASRILSMTRKCNIFCESLTQYPGSR